MCDLHFPSIMSPRKRRRRRTRRGQRGGILPLAALIPALIAGGKAAALGAVSGAAGYGFKKGLRAATRKRRAPTTAERRRFKNVLRRGNPKSLMARRI